MNSVKKWPGYVFVGFGIANILYALAGLYTLVPLMFKFFSAFEPDLEIPYLAHAFFTMASINIVFLVCLCITGLYLVKKASKVILFCNILFASELIYFFSIGMFWLVPKVGMSIGGATGIGNMGIVWQIITGYPIIALIVLNIAKAKYRMTPLSDNTL